MLSSFVRLSDDAAGLEKILRFGQYVSQTGAALTLASVGMASPWKQAQMQLALARRYFRLLKWHGSWSLAYQHFNSDRLSPVERMLQVGKWSFLGLYLFFEMFTITNAMKVTDYDWGPAMQREAVKFWLYSIVTSIFLSIYQLFTSVGRLDEKKTQSSQSRTRIYTQLAIDCGDVLVPGSILAWIPIDEMYVGMAGSISTLLGGQDIWARVQS